jgi:hypothetical protein
MDYSPEALFDTLYLGNNLVDELGDVASSEIHLFSYLSCLISLYDSNPISFWGYKFIKNEFGSPYCHEINEAIDSAFNNGYLINVDEFYFNLTSEGKEILTVLEEHKQFAKRSQYLRISLDCIAMMSYGIVKESITNEPVLSSARKHENRRTLIEEETASINLLYNNFRILHKALKHKTDDLVVPALVWLRKLFEDREGRDEEVFTE